MAAVFSAVVWVLEILPVLPAKRLRTACRRESHSCQKASGACLYRIFPGLYEYLAPIEYLRKVFTEAIEDPDVKVLAIATRPDCLDSDVLELLDELNQIKPVWVELGLQTIHPEPPDTFAEAIL